MKKGIFLLSIIILFAAQQGFSQDYLFKVLASKGQNKVAQTSIKVGSALHKGDQITLAEGGYLGLAHHTGRTIELSKSGKYLVNDLVKQIKTHTKGTGAKYLEYVLSETTQKTSNSILEKRYAYMTKPAGVRREDPSILFYLPNSAKVLGNEAFISWFINDTEPQVVKKFKLVIEDEFGVLIDERIVEGQATFLNLYDPKLKEHRMLTYKIIALDNPRFASDAQFFFKMNQNDADIYSDYTILKEAETALEKIILAKFFEEKGLIVDAMTSYQQAMQLAPDVNSYQKLYDDFLERAKLVKEKLR